MIRRDGQAAVVRVVLADRHREVRDALRLLLEQEDGARVSGEAASAQELLEGVGAWLPDLVLLDWELPGLAGPDTLREVRALCPRAVVVVLSGQPQAEAASLAAGADGFVSKADPPERVVARVRACCGGREEQTGTPLGGEGL